MEKLETALKNAGIKRKDFAARLNVNQSTIDRWCNGERRPAKKRIPEIIKILYPHIKLEDFFEGVSSVSPIRSSNCDDAA